MNFEGKRVLVTGSTGGIGEACARLFAALGATVMVCGRDAERGRAVVEAIQAAGPAIGAVGGGSLGAGTASGARSAAGGGLLGADDASIARGTAGGGVLGAEISSGALGVGVGGTASADNASGAHGGGLRAGTASGAHGTGVSGAGTEDPRVARRRALFTQIDLRDTGACELLISITIERLGGLDVLVNNAGVLYSADALGTTDAQWLDTLAVNVNALFYLSRAAVRHMKTSGGGAIVNIASEWGMNGEPGHVAYCASKGAVIQITRCMALDHASDRVRVNAVSPGEIHTRMVDDILAARGGDPAQALRQLAAGIPMRRLAQPVEVARCVCFLASDLASYVTGANLTVDGGNDATAGPYPGSAS